MAQFAVHIATGIYTGDLLKGSKELRCGLVIGSFAPDLDFIALVAVCPFSPTLARSFHRYASHSLLIPLLLLTISIALYLVTRKRTIMDWGVGLGLGLTSHIVLDILFWFNQVQVLWPLNLWGISGTIDIWKGYVPPTPIHLFIDPASEFLFYGMLYQILRRRVVRFQTNTRFAPILHRLERLSLVVFGMYVVLIFILPRSVYEEVVYGATTFLFGPLSLYLLWKLQRTIINIQPNTSS